MIYHIQEHTIACIADDDLSYAVKQRMVEKGVPIVSTRPHGKSFSEMLSERLKCLGTGSAHREAYNELAAMKRHGASAAEIEKRILELTKGSAVPASPSTSEGNAT
jgi:hypothetical protein